MTMGIEGVRAVLTGRQDVRPLEGMKAARDWAESASRNDLKAYALAAFEAMTAEDRAAFVQHISKVEKAA